MPSDDDHVGHTHTHWMSLMHCFMPCNTSAKVVDVTHNLASQPVKHATVTAKRYVLPAAFPVPGTAWLRCLQVLLNNRPEATTALLMQLCTPGDSSKPDGDWIAKVSDFAHLAADRYTAAVFVILPTLLPTGILLLSVCCQ